MLTPARLGAAADIVERWLLAGVITAAVLGLVLHGPAGQVSEHGGIPAALVALVLATGASLTPSAWRAAGQALARVAVTVAACAVILPVLAWAAGLALADPVLRDGVLAVGVAPAEVASVALAGMAGGQAALTVAVVTGSVLATVLTAGPVLALLGSQAGVSPAALLVQLVFIVGAPLAAGMALRALTGDRPAPLAVTRMLGVLALLTLLWQVAGRIQVTAAYARVTLALAVFLAGSAALGRLLAIRQPPPQRMALILPVGMRDFAIAAGVATSAYGPPAAAPMAAYGLLVLLYGSTYAHLAGRRAS